MLYTMSSLTCNVAIYHLLKLQIIALRIFMDKKQVSFRIEPDIIKRLKYIALEQDRSLTDIFIEAIQDVLKKHEKQPKE